MPRNSGPVEDHLKPEMIIPTEFPEVVNPEKDIAYYVMLLRIKEKEIERCTKAYEDLQITLKCCLSTNAKLKDRIDLLEQTLDESDDSKRKNAEMFKKQVAEVTKNLALTKRNHDVRMHELENEYKRKMLDMERMYADKFNRQGVDFQKKVDEINVKFKRESLLNSSLKSNIESIMNTNIGLKSKIHLMKSKLSSDKMSFGMEINELKDMHMNVNGEVLRLRRELDRVMDLNTKFKRIITDYQSKSRVDADRLTEISRLNRTCKHINNQLTGELYGYKMKNTELENRLDELIVKEGRLKEEIERLKVLGNAMSGYSSCNIPEHGSYDQVTRQNAVLQEIVKEMRRERHNKDSEELRNAEDRIEKLEDAMEDFKKTSLFKTASVNAGGDDGNK